MYKELASYVYSRAITGKTASKPLLIVEIIVEKSTRAGEQAAYTQNTRC